MDGEEELRQDLHGHPPIGVLIGPDGKVRNAWYKISPKDTPLRLLEALGE